MVEEDLEGTNEELTFLSADSGASDTEGKTGKTRPAAVDNVDEEEKKGQTNPEEETKEYRSPSMTDCVPGLTI